MGEFPEFFSREHLWLRLDRALAYVIGRRMEESPTPRLDAALDLLMAEHRRVERAGWFNWGRCESTGLAT